MGDFTLSSAWIPKERSVKQKQKSCCTQVKTIYQNMSTLFMCSYAKWKVPTRSQRSFHILDRDLWPLCEFCCKNQSPFQILWISLSHFVLTHNKVFSDGCRIIYSASWSTHKRCPCPLSHDLLPCSLLLSPLCDVCPPLDGPGVPPERVDAVSSWSLFQDVWEKERQNRKVNQLIEYSTFTDLKFHYHLLKALV